MLTVSFTLNAFFLSAFVEGMKRYLLGRIVDLDLLCRHGAGFALMIYASS